MKQNKELKGIDGMNAVERFLKRLGDIVGSSLLMVLLTPVFIYIYLRQKITNSGPDNLDVSK